MATAVKPLGARLGARLVNCVCCVQVIHALVVCPSPSLPLLPRPAGAACVRCRQGQLQRMHALLHHTGQPIHLHLHPSAFECTPPLQAPARTVAHLPFPCALPCPQSFSQLLSACRSWLLALLLCPALPQSFSVEISHEETLLSGQVAYLQVSCRGRARGVPLFAQLQSTAAAAFKGQHLAARAGRWAGSVLTHPPELAT